MGETWECKLTVNHQGCAPSPRDRNRRELPPRRIAARRQDRLHPPEHVRPFIRSSTKHLADMQSCSTVATNSLLERQGAPHALLVTKVRRLYVPPMTIVSTH